MHDEIQEIIFWLSNDNSYVDERDVQSKATDIAMKVPYLISGYEVDSASNKKLFSKLFALGCKPSDQFDANNLLNQSAHSHEAANNGLDLLRLKKLVGSSYTLCNFAAQEAMWEASQAERRCQI